MTTTTAAVISLVLLFNVGCIAGLALALRRRHQYLFGRILDLQKKCSDSRDRLRKETRLARIEACNRPNPDQAIPPRFTAQEGEDILIYDFFEDEAPGFFVEAGAYDGITFSNTYLLEAIGWRGLLIEPHPDKAKLCKSNRPNSSVVQAALGPDDAEGEIQLTCADALSFVVASQSHVDRCKRGGHVLQQISVPLVSLNSLLEGRTEKVDFMSLDVEGMELQVLEGFNIERYSPRMMLIEQNDAQGDARVAEYLETRGYRAIARKGCNAFYVPVDLADRLESLLFYGESIQDRVDAFK